MVSYEHRPISVAGKRVVVVGGTSGIGQAIALGFAAEGADVVATSRRNDAVADTAAAIEDTGANTLRITCDVTERSTLERLRDEVVDEFDGIDVVVGSQGAISRQSVLTVEDADWNRVTDVTLDGVRRLTQAMLPAMDEGGSIINVSSLAARLALANAPAYSAAKGGVEAFTRASAKELAPEIRVNAIAPGFVITPQNAETYAEGTEKRQKIDERTPLGRVAEREEMVGAALFLASDGASFVTGEVLTVDGGFADSAL
jgi:NAD(P)-dependent dehydrogenase (short-subunit alcohol dehydrogenase family)